MASTLELDPSRFRYRPVFDVANLNTGNYRVRVVQQSGFTRTAPSGGTHSFFVAPAQNVTGKFFGEKKV